MNIGTTTLEYQIEQSKGYESTRSSTIQSIMIQEHTLNKLTIAEVFQDVPRLSVSTAIKIPIINQWENERKWQGKIRKRFDELSIKEAINEITGKELLELELISDRRRILLNPRASSDIEMDIKNERALLKVLEGLSEYVRPI